MIFQGKIGFIFCRKNLKHLLHSSFLKFVLKMRLEKISRPLVQIVVVNIAQRFLKNFVQSMAYEENSQQPIHRNQTVYQRGGIGQFLTW